MGIQERFNEFSGSSQINEPQTSEAPPASIEDRFSNFNSEDQFKQPQVEIEKKEKSPISISDRLGFSFSDDAGKQKALESKFQFVQRLPNGKFAVGNDINNINPIDPEGVFNDVLGDLADIAGEIPVVAGQMLGSTIGGTAGSIIPGAGTTGGVIAGGAGGAAVGEAIKLGVGRVLGVRENKALEEATDIAITGAFGAGGEVLGKALSFSGKGLSKLAKKGFDKLLKSSSQPSKSLKLLGKVFKLTAAVDPDDVVTAGSYGFEKSLSPKYMNPEFSRILMTDFTKGIIDKDKALGKAVGEGKNWAKNKFGKELVDIEGAGAKLLNTLSDPKVGLIDELGRVNRSAFTEASDFRAIKNLTDLYFAKNFKTKGLVPRKLPLSQALDFKDRSRPLLNKYFKSNGKNADAERAIAQYLDEINGAVSSITSKAGPNNPFTASNNAFRSWKQDVDLLKSNGLDVTGPGDLKSLFRNGRIVSQKIENFFERFKIKNSSTEEAFKIISEKLPNRFPNGGIGGTVGSLVDELNKFNAAQGFVNANPNFIRLASVAGLAGLNFEREGPLGAGATLGIGLLLGTPAGARVILKGASKAKRSILGGLLKKSKPKQKGKDISKFSNAILSRLIQKETGQ